MNRAMQKNARRVRERRLSTILLIVVVVVLFVGLFTQITWRASLSGQAKKIAALQAEINELDALAKNLDMNIGFHHNLVKIGERAVTLGMSQPDETQLRVVSLPAAYGNTSTQTVANIDSEEING